MKGSLNRLRLRDRIRATVPLCLAAAFYVLLPACVSSHPIRYYRIEISPPPPVATVGVADVSLQVGAIDAPAIMRDGRILYGKGAHEIGTYEYHRWVESPDRLVQASLLRLLRASGSYTSVEARSSSVRADYVVQGRIYEFSEIDTSVVHTRISMEIELHEAATGRTVWSRMYRHEEPVSGREVPDVVESFDKNLKQGLSEIVNGLQQYFAGRARPQSD